MLTQAVHPQQFDLSIILTIFFIDYLRRKITVIFLFMNSLSPTLTPTKYTNEHKDNSVTPKLKRKLSNPISQKLAIIYDMLIQINMITRHLITVLKKNSRTGN